MNVRHSNVLMVLADQLHAGWLGVAGHPQARTPNLDAFARESVRFTRAYCQNPICTPSRVSLLSGQYRHNHGYYGLGGPQPRGLPSLFHHFQKHGYRTAAYGKLHLPNDPRNWIADAVDEFGDTYESIDGEHGRSEFLDELARDGLRHLEDSWHHVGHYSDVTIPLDARCSDLPYERTQERWCVQKAVDFIARDPAAPFCIQIALQKPHHPLFPQRQFWELYPENTALPETLHQPPDLRPPNFQARWRELRERTWEFAAPGESWIDGARRAWRGTLACVSQVDDVFGRLLRQLAELGIAGRTIVIFGSDHGAYHTMHGIAEKAPGICSDAVCRVPMLWRVPGPTLAGHSCDALVENVDIVPTLASLCGLPPVETADGQNLEPLLRGGAQPVREGAITENVWSRAIVWDRWRFVHYPREFPLAGIESGELYDLAADPNETRNLYYSPEHQAVVADGRRRLLDWIAVTTRCTTTLCIPVEGSYLQGHVHFSTAADGRAPRHLQPRERRNLRVDYL